MKPTSSAIFFFIFLITVDASPRGVSHEDIRDAILSFVHMFRDISDKLDRHEYRERQLGEQLKKMIAGVDHRERDQDTALKEINETLKRLETKLGKLESASDLYINGKDKGTYTVDTMNESIQLWLTNIESSIRNQSLTLSKDRTQIEAMEASLGSRIDHLSSSLEKLESHVLRTTPSTAVDIVNYEGVISRFEDKITQLKLNNPDSFQTSVQEKLNHQEKVLGEIKQLTTTAIQSFSQLSEHNSIDQVINSTYEELEKVKYELIKTNEKTVSKLEDKLDALKSAISRDQENLYKAVTDGSVTAEGLYADVQKSYDQLSIEVKALSKVEQVLIQTADNVLDTKRRIEYGVHQILLEVGDLVKQQSKDLNTTMNKRFDDVSEIIVVNHNGGFNNLSSKIETEISQVWRQIGIMYQQLTASADALDRLQHQTETYVNGSLHTMDSMEGKVGLITSRMSEVDDNLNYLLGRLSLVTQEFNQIKTGLGTALDNIRSSFLSVQDKVKDVGPGPNPIASNGIDDN